MTYFFILKKESKKHNTQLPVYIRITVDGSYCKLSTKRKCDPSNWNLSAGRIGGKSDEAKAFNSYLNTLQQKVFEAKPKLIEIDEDLTPESIKNLVTGKNNKKQHMLLEVFKYHNDQIAALVNQEYAPGTFERYKTSYKHTESFLNWKYNLQDIDVTKLNYEFITDYEFWLKSIRKCNHNTIAKYLSNFKKIVIRCMKNGLIQKDPFLRLSMAKKEVDRKRQKTDVLSRIPLLPLALKIINMYQGTPPMQISGSGVVCFK